MQTPLQVAFEHVDHSEFIEKRIREEAEKLEQFYNRIVSMRVVVGRPQHRHHKGDAYRIGIHITVPGTADIAISRESGDSNAHENAYVTIRDAFKAAQRQLKELSGRRHSHAAEPERP